MMTVVAIFILIFKIPLLIIVYMFKHKILIIALVLGIGALIFSRSCGSNGPEATQVELPQYQKVSPSINEAPYIIRTTSRLYYVAEYKDDGDTVIMTKYFSYNKDKWIFNSVPLNLDKKIYGEVSILRR